MAMLKNKAKKRLDSVLKEMAILGGLGLGLGFVLGRLLRLEIAGSLWLEIVLWIAVGLVGVPMRLLIFGNQRLRVVQRRVLWGEMSLFTGFVIAHGIEALMGMGIGHGLALALWLELYQRFSKQSPSTSQLDRLYSFFPEEQRNDVTTKLRRLREAKKPEWFIWLMAIHYWIELFKATIQIQWDNLWLLKNRNINK